MPSARTRTALTMNKTWSAMQVQMFANDGTGLAIFRSADRFQILCSTQRGRIEHRDYSAVSERITSDLTRLKLIQR